MSQLTPPGSLRGTWIGSIHGTLALSRRLRATSGDFHLGGLASPSGRTMVWLVVCNYLQAGIGFWLNLWLANRLGSDGFGAMSYCVVVGGICGVLVGFASDKTLVRDLVQAPARAEVFTASLVQRLLVAMLVVGTCLAMAGWMSRGETVRILALVVGALWGSLMGLLPTAWLDVRRQMGVSAALQLGERLMFALLTVALLSRCSPQMAAMAVLVCMLLARLIAFPAQWACAAASFRPTVRNLGSGLQTLTRDNVLVLGGSLAGLLLTHVNLLVLEYRAGVGHLAYYAVALQLISLVTIVQSQVLRLVTPRIAEMTRVATRHADLYRGLLFCCAQSLAVTIVLTLPLMVCAPWILSTCFRAEYQAAATPLRILCVWVALYGPALIVNQFLLCFRLNRAYLILTMLSGLMALALGQLLVPRYGADGVAWSLLFSHTPSMIAQVIVVVRAIRRRCESSNPVKPAAQAPHGGVRVPAPRIAPSPFGNCADVRHCQIVDT